MNPELTHTIQFTKLGDDRGALVVAESAEELPFPVERIYWIHGTEEGVERGFHSHKEFKQVLVAVKGSCLVELEDKNGSSSVKLDSPSTGLYVGPHVWHVMKDFSEDCVLLVMASHKYDESDYIRSYEDFKNTLEG